MLTGVEYAKSKTETLSHTAASLTDMFTQQQPERKRWRLSHGLSLIIHAAVVFMLVKPPAPVFIKPVSIALGNWGKATTLYLPSQALVEAQAAREEKTLIYIRAPKQIAPHGKTKPKVKPQLKIRDVEVAENLPKAGSPYGSLFSDIMNGSEVRPALPMVFPDPPVHRSEIPNGVAGSVIVEVTIDAQGKVIETRLLQGLGYGIEEKVIATLHNWRFRPATKDGVPIPSKQDVYFRFPS
jgi:TonB family protein